MSQKRTNNRTMDIKFNVQGGQKDMERLDQNLRALARTAELISTATFLQKSLIKNEVEDVIDWLSYLENDLNMLKGIVEANDKY